jgi:hypothetical protein
VRFDSCLAVVPKLSRVSGALSVEWFLGPISIQKTGRGACSFFLSSPNRNHGKVLPSFLKKTSILSIL